MIFVAGAHWHEVLGESWLDPAMLRRGVVCAAVAQLGFLCCTLLGGVLGGLHLAVLDVGTGRVRGRWLIGRRVLLLRTIPLPVRFGLFQPKGGVATARRWLLAVVPALASTAAAVWIVWQELNFDRPVGPIPPSWLRPATAVAVFAFAWLVLIGGQLNVASQLPIRVALWRPRRYAPPESVATRAGLARAQRISLADHRGDTATVQAELDALAGTMSEQDLALMRGRLQYLRGEYAAASAGAAALLDVAGPEDLATRFGFCLYTGLAMLAGQPVDPDTAARARELCPALGYAIQRDGAAFVLALFALYDRDAELARQFAQQSVRWATNARDAGEAELVAAVAAAIAGDGREARRALRRGRRRAPTSPLVAVAERRLSEPPAITVTVDTVGAGE
ncbi:hypothetical protein Athai_40270 [Actinocatenispora thailandica]|uniref:Uncharacterized protein n=2 Tax=Actinocatenispora thailandica TaxID=227318 RepID=A0A7R7DRK8_9ACTN|nr:hypothetical protein [Actinocatenispora thailandica]BCJ36524.1 hypothetical protein Athai_40270 [Actinocatenispora thailandica]